MTLYVPIFWHIFGILQIGGIKLSERMCKKLLDIPECTDTEYVQIVSYALSGISHLLPFFRIQDGYWLQELLGKLYRQKTIWEGLSCGADKKNPPKEDLDLSLSCRFALRNILGVADIAMQSGHLSDDEGSRLVSKLVFPLITQSKDTCLSTAATNLLHCFVSRNGQLLDTLVAHDDVLGDLCTLGETFYHEKAKLKVLHDMIDALPAESAGVLKLLNNKLVERLRKSFGYFR